MFPFMSDLTGLKAVEPKASVTMNSNFEIKEKPKKGTIAAQAFKKSAEGISPSLGKVTKLEETVAKNDIFCY